MRVTSPPKHPNDFQRISSPLQNQSTFNNISNQIHRSFHQLKSPQRTGPQKSPKNIKQTLYAELRNRELEYGQIITQLNKENNSLKVQLGKAQLQQSKRSSLTTIMSVSPQKLSQKSFIAHHNSDNFAFRNLDNNRVMNQTFSGFHHPTFEQTPVMTVRPNLSPFSKKPVIMSHTSPVGFRPGMVSVVSPTKRVLRPVSNLVQFSHSVTIRSPQKKPVNHSYQPSLVSFKYPSQQQSLDCSPKKSFEQIIGFDSDIFSNNSNSQYTPEVSSQENNQPTTQNAYFFDMKKRQLNYGSVFDKEKSVSSSKSIHTTLKMSTKNIIQNLQNQIESQGPANKDEQSKSHLNPLSTKQCKKDKSCKEVSVEIKPQQNILEQKCKQFNLEENIEKNPLLNMLKQRLQEEVNVLNKKTNEPEPAEVVSLFEQNSHNPNIRYSGDKQHFQVANYAIHPLKRNIYQSFPLLHQLRSAQNSQQPQANESALEHEQHVENQNQQTNGSLGQNNQRSQSRLSDKVSRQNTSELIIEQTENHQRPMTIVRMLDDTRRMADSKLEQDQDEQLINLSDQGIEPAIDFIGVNHEQEELENEMENHNNQVYLDQASQSSDQDVQQQVPQTFIISNKYYCQNTQQNQSIHQSSITKLPQFEEEELISKKSITNSQTLLIDQSQKTSKQVSSKKIVVSLQKNEATSQQEKNEMAQIEIANISDSESSPCKFYENQKEPQSEKLTLIQRLNQSAKYDTFYVSKNNKNCQSTQVHEIKGLKGVQKYQESRISDAWSENSLRSQRFKKISNRAYL